MLKARLNLLQGAVNLSAQSTLFSGYFISLQEVA